MWIVIGELIAISLISLFAYILYASFRDGGFSPPSSDSGEEGDDPLNDGPNDEPEGDLPTGGGGNKPELNYIQPTEAINREYLRPDVREDEEEEEEEEEDPEPSVGRCLPVMTV